MPPGMKTEGKGLLAHFRDPETPGAPAMLTMQNHSSSQPPTAPGVPGGNAGGFSTLPSTHVHSYPLPRSLSPSQLLSIGASLSHREFPSWFIRSTKTNSTNPEPRPLSPAASQVVSGVKLAQTVPIATSGDSEGPDKQSHHRRPDVGPLML
jgi:hypothetical protein